MYSDRLSQIVDQNQCDSMPGINASLVSAFLKQSTKTQSDCVSSKYLSKLSSGTVISGSEEKPRILSILSS